MHPNLVEIKDLSFYHENKLLYKNLSLNIKKGKIVAIMGPSGIGKTTLLKLIGGQLKANKGEILFKGHDVGKISKSKLFELRKEIGMLFQSGALFTDLDVFDNVAFALRQNTNLSEAIIKNIVFMKLEAVGLLGAHHLMPNELSGGMARRVALARSIALDPSLIMYDEPFTGQDPISLGILLNLISRLNQILKITSIIVTHDVPEVMQIADYIYIIADKKIIAKGSPNRIKQSLDPMTIQFLEGKKDGPVAFHYPGKKFSQLLLGK